MGITIKRQYGFAQWLVIPILSMATIIVGVYMNTQLTFMLPKKELFNVPKDKVGMEASLLTIYSMPFSMVTTFFMSYVFEIIGRKFTIFLSFFSTAILYYILPQTAPSFALLIAVRCAVGITMSAPLAHPLIADYVIKRSRGQSIALMGLGVTMGEVVAMGILFNYTKDMDEHTAFSIVALVIFGFSLFFLIFIKDPNLKKLQKRIDKGADTFRR